MRRIVAVALDLSIIALAMPLALLLRENLVLDIVKLEYHVPFLIAMLLVSVPLFRMLGVDRTLWRYSTIEDHLRIAVAMVLVVLAATALTFAYNRLDHVSRSVPVIQAILAVFGMVGLRVAKRAWHGIRAGARPFAPIDHRPAHNILIVGLNGMAELYAKAVTELGGDGVRVVGIVDHADSRNDGMRLQQLPVFGGGRRIQDVVNTLAIHGVFVDRVVIATPAAHLTDAGHSDIDDFMKSSPLPVEFFADNLGITNWAGTVQPASRPRASLKTADASATVALDSPQDSPSLHDNVAFSFSRDELDQIAARPYWQLKRSIDIIVSLCMMLVLWPIALIVAVVVAFDVGTPVIFWQVRPGVGGRSFALYKFRTMQDGRDRNGRLRSDAERLSRIGAFLRKTRLDELPQLWNILIGEMSFIGPRPLLPIDQSPAYAARLLVRPGLTGWGQIIGGRDIPAADKAALDVWYVKNASLALDLAIIKGTIPMVIRGERVDRKEIERAWLELSASGICRDNGSSAGVGLAHGSGRVTA